MKRGFRPTISIPPPMEASYDVAGLAEGKFMAQGLQVDADGAKLGDEDLGELQIDLSEIKMLEPLGQGASGVVYKVQNERTKQFMAVKTFSIYDKENRHQTVKELKALHTASKAGCSSLLKFYGATFKEGVIQIFIELMDAGDLSNVMKQCGKIPLDILACFATQMLSALDFIHKFSTIHRDIKPQNVCLNTMGEAKLTDFGLARNLDSSIAVANTYVGTYAYMAPERILGKAYNWPSDIWSLGLVLLECADGKYPFPPSDNMMQALGAIAGPTPSPGPQGDSNEFKDFIAKCLQKDPQQRPKASELLMHKFLTDHKHITKERAAQWVIGLKKSKSK